MSFLDVPGLTPGTVAEQAADPESPLGVVLSATYARVSDLILNVKREGAVGDGLTDDTSAIQGALNKLPSGGALYFPEGNYLCNGSLTVPSYLRFLGVGRSARVTYTGNGTFIALAEKREVKWENLRFVATGTTGILFSLSNSFRCEWRDTVLQGQFVGPANTGSYLAQTGVVFTANAGDNNLTNCDVINFGEGIRTDSIQNGIIGGKIGTCNIGINGFGGGGMSVTGYTVFVAAPTATAIHVKAAGAGQWLFTNVWMEGCGTAVQIGSNTPGSIVSPSQFGMNNCKISATTTVLDIQAGRNPFITNVQVAGDSGGTATPEPYVIDAVNAPQGTLEIDSTITGKPVVTSVLPIGWKGHTRSGNTATMKVPNSLEFSYGAALRMARSDGSMISTLQMTGGPQLLLRAPTSGALSAIRVLDTSAAVMCDFDTVASSVNYPAFAPAVTNSGPKVMARGTDANIDLLLTPKGTGKVVPVGGLKLPAYTTADRPAPATAGEGTTIYDSTLKLPIFSDGTTWKNYAGTAV